MAFEKLREALTKTQAIIVALTALLLVLPALINAGIDGKGIIL